MTRRVVAIEGKRTQDGRMLKPGSIKFNKKSIPVTTDGSYTVVGKAKDFERDEETGEISLDIILKFKIPGEVNAHISLYELVCTKNSYDDDEDMVIESGTLVGIFLSIGGSAWPELSYQNKEKSNE